MLKIAEFKFFPMTQKYRIILEKVRGVNRYTAQVNILGIFWMDCGDLDYIISFFFPNKKPIYNDMAGVPCSGNIALVDLYIMSKMRFKYKRDKVERISRYKKIVMKYWI